DAGLNWGFMRRIALVGSSSLAFALVVFLAVPRIGKSTTWRKTDSLEKRRIVAFSESVTLGKLGEGQEDGSMVMRVEFFDQRTNERYRVAGAPLLRGALLYQYENGEWRRSAGQPVPWPVTEELPFEEEWVRQVITLQPGREDPVLFCAAP